MTNAWLWSIVAVALWFKAGMIAYDIDREILRRIAAHKCTEHRRAELRSGYRYMFWAAYLLIISAVMYVGR